MTTRTDGGAAGGEPSGTEGPRLRRRSNGAEYVVAGDMLVGRGLECDIVISDGDSISRRHAQLSLDGETLHVADLGSTNGTHVNGHEVTERTALADGDVVAFDEYEFDVVVPPPPEPVDPEATRLVDRDALMARLGRDPSAPSSASAAKEAAKEAAGEAIGEAVGEAAEDGRETPDEAAARAPVAGGPDREGGPERDDTSVPRDIVDDMAEDDWTWPALDDDLDGPVIELADESSAPDDALFDDDDAPAPSRGERERPEEPRSGPASDHDADHAPPTPSAPVASARPFRSVRPIEADTPVEPTEADAPIGSDAPLEPLEPDVASLPGAWANTTAVHDGNPEHTVIAKYIVPRPKTPPEIDPATLAGPALLVGTDEPGGQILALAGERTEWIVGSGPASDLRIRHEGVSTRHAVLSREGGKWRLCDELSVNGTYANGQRLNAGYVGDGDELRFGPVECRFVVPTKGGSTAGGGSGGGGRTCRGRGHPHVARPRVARDTGLLEDDRHGRRRPPGRRTGLRRGRRARLVTSDSSAEPTDGTIDGAIGTATGRSVDADPTPARRRRTRGSRGRTSALAVALGGAFLVGSGGADAHEFWLEPHRYRIAAGEELVADVRNGEDYVGERFPYLPDRYRRLYLSGEDVRLPVGGRLGDLPAVRRRIDEPGDYTLVLESGENAIVHETIDGFRDYLAYHGLERVEDVHARLGLPDTSIAEIYSRFAKALVGVTDGDGIDDGDAASVPRALEVGLTFEIVPLADPRDAGTTMLPVSVRFLGRALRGVQLEAFRRAPDGRVSRETFVTDAEGLAALDIGPPGEYLLNSVQLIRPRLSGGAVRADVHWESLWASLTFERRAGETGERH